jgi:subtilisin family serine protease
MNRMVTVAIIDSGITPERRTDGWLSSVPRTGGENDAGDSGSNVDPLHYVPDSPRLEYGSGHGTFVAGIVAQVCPSARIVMYRAFAADGLASEMDVAEALVDAAMQGADIINLSLGHQTLDDEPSIPLVHAMEQVAAIQAEQNRQIVVVAAAGNSGEARPTWPAALDSVVAVGALTAGLAPAAWSSHGPWVDVLTVAQGVLSTYVPGQSFDESGAPLEEFGENAFARWSGTSFAAPQVSGAIAQQMCHTGMGARDALDAVLDGAVAQEDGPPVLMVLPGY